MSTAPIVFIRHGETDWNRQMRLQGRQDIALNTLGRRQAARNGRILPLLLGDAQWRFVASPQSRAVDTMEIALQAAGMAGRTFETDERLKEISFGQWEGLTLAEVNETHAGGGRRRQADKWRFVPPGGESYADLASRIGAWLDEQQGPVVVVGHGGVLRILQYRLGGVAAAEAPLLAVPHDRLFVFSRGRVITV